MADWLKDKTPEMVRYKLRLAEHIRELCCEYELDPSYYCICTLLEKLEKQDEVKEKTDTNEDTHLCANCAQMYKKDIKIDFWMCPICLTAVFPSPRNHRNWRRASE